MTEIEESINDIKKELRNPTMPICMFRIIVLQLVNTIILLNKKIENLEDDLRSKEK
jgi:hypothetical protein